MYVLNCININDLLVSPTGSNEAFTIRRAVENSVLKVTGLTPGVSYTFSVTAENAVSPQDSGNLTPRTASATVSTLKGGELKVSVSMFTSGKKVQDDIFMCVLCVYVCVCTSYSAFKSS